MNSGLTDEMYTWLDTQRQAGRLIDPKIYLGWYFLTAGYTSVRYPTIGNERYNPWESRP